MTVLVVAASLLGMDSVYAQNRNISGTVVDTGGLPVIGAAVTVVGNTRIGAATDINGAFTLSVPAGANISVESIGYKSQTFPIGNQTTFNIVLEEDTEMLEETVVIGYGVQKKSDLTGAVASVRSEDLENRSTTDAAAALQGKAAGIQIINTSGAPGEGASIRVRGYSSNSGSIGPLLIVDGLKVDNIQYLDPSMIESMEVLKDAASAAIYGAQAGNGVVLITTKSGKDGHSSVTFNGRFTLQSLGKKADIFHAKDYIEYQTYIGNLTPELLTANGYNGIDNDWYESVYQPSWSKQYGVTFQGGNNKGHFFTSLNYVDNDGIFVGKKDTYQRLTAQINADYQIFKWLNVSTNNSIEKWGRRSVSNGYGSVLNSVVSIDPLTPAYISDIKNTPGGMQEHYATDPNLIPRDPTHNNDFYGTSKFLEEATGNPLFQRDKTDSSSGGINIRGAFAANLTPITGLTITSRFGYRINQNSSHSYTKPYWLTSMAQSPNHDISANVNTSYYYQWENFANYNRTFGKHNVGAMVGMSYTEERTDNASMSANGPDALKGYEPNFLYIDYVNPIESTSRGYGNAPNMSAQLSYFGRLMYSFDNRYSLQANFRADAYDSSKLSKQARWGYFPSVSAGWTISNEPFFRDNVGRDAVAFLKLRASWGLNGNVNVLSDYRYSTSIALNGQFYQYNPSAGDGRATYGSMPSGLANPDLKWETSEQLDFGLDARFLNNRLSLTVDWYRKLTNDLLISISPLPEIGVSSTTVNAGKVLNQGLEFELGWRDNIGDFHYSVNANLSTLKNEVLEVHSLLDRINTDVVSGLNEVLVTSFEAGYPIWYFRGYKYAGVNAEGAPQYLGKDGKILEGMPGENDKQYLGEGIPNLTYGLTINLAWKGLDLVIFGTGVAGNEIYNLMVSADRTKTNGLTTFWKNSWGNPAVDKASAKYPDMKRVATSWEFFSSNAAVFDGSFFKIKQVQLGYTLPRAITQKALISDLRFFVSLDDYFTFTKYPGADPETASLNNSSSRGVDSGSYPTTKKVVFGVNLTF
ncbi:MAG: TonB-dependent receptor [Bacteroidales bacterium]|nr:TonB-dependent receptor [Bacteroidales bacterium]